MNYSYLHEKWLGTKVHWEVDWKLREIPRLFCIRCYLTATERNAYVYCKERVTLSYDPFSATAHYILCMCNTVIIQLELFAVSISVYKMAEELLATIYTYTFLYTLFRIYFINIMQAGRHLQLHPLTRLLLPKIRLKYQFCKHPKIKESKSLVSNCFVVSW